MNFIKSNFASKKYQIDVFKAILMAIILVL